VGDTDKHIDITWAHLPEEANGVAFHFLSFPGRAATTPTRRCDPAVPCCAPKAGVSSPAKNKNANQVTENVLYLYYY